MNERASPELRGGDAFGSAAYLAELLPTYLNRALSRLPTPSTRS